MIRKYYILLVLSILFSYNIFAGPGTYYNSVDTTLSCGNFKTALFNLISVDFHKNYGDIDSFFNKTDLKPAEAPFTGSVVVERYCSDIPTGLDSCNFRYNDRDPNVRSFCFSGGTANAYCKCYAKEHVVPKAWFNGSNSFSIKQYTDMNYLWPADSKINNDKSNYPLGYVKVASNTSYNGTKVGSSDAALNYGYSSTTVFEPIDSFKGDFARAYLYFVTRYQDSVPAFRRNPIAVNVFSSTSYTDLEPWILQLCVKWHKMDPPSAFEKQRNDSVYAIQGNRNPYIDYPHWVERVFGIDGNASGCVASGIKINNSEADFSLYPNPAKDILSIGFERIQSLNDARLEIVDIVGRKIRVQNITSNQMQLDISTLEKGMYFINVLYKGESNVKPFVKE